MPQQSILGAMQDKVWSDANLTQDFPNGPWQAEIPPGIKPTPLLVIEESTSGEVEQTFESVYIEKANVKLTLWCKSDINDLVIGHIKYAFRDGATLDQALGSDRGLDTTSGTTIRIMPLGIPISTVETERAVDNQLIYRTEFEYEVWVRRTL